MAPDPFFPVDSRLPRCGVSNGTFSWTTPESPKQRLLTAFPDHYSGGPFPGNLFSVAWLFFPVGLSHRVMIPFPHLTPFFRYSREY